MSVRAVGSKHKIISFVPFMPFFIHFLLNLSFLSRRNISRRFHHFPVTSSNNSPVLFIAPVKLYPLFPPLPLPTSTYSPGLWLRDVEVDGTALSFLGFFSPTAVEEGACALSWGFPPLLYSSFSSVLG